MWLKIKAWQYRQVLPKVLPGQPAVLMHGGTKKKNIIIRRGSEGGGPLELAERWLVPELLETRDHRLRFVVRLRLSRWVDEYMKPFPNEYARLSMLAQELTIDDFNFQDYQIRRFVAFLFPRQKKQHT